MLFTLLVVVLTATFIILFSKEISDGIKKIFTIPTAPLLLPLFTASLLVIIFNIWVVWGVKYVQWILLSSVHVCVQWLPFQNGAEVLVKMILLILSTLLPVLILQVYYAQKLLKNFKYTYLMSTILCVFVSLLLIG